MEAPRQPFYEVLDELIKKVGQTPGRLAELTCTVDPRTGDRIEASGLSRKTIESWREGTVKRPREWRDLLRLAQAMRLTKAEVNRLLTAARHATVDALWDDATSHNDGSALALLATWRQEQTPPAVAPPRRTPFLTVPPPAPVIGRAEEFARLTQVVTGGPAICVLYGMAGVGKTALAIKAAHELRSAFPDGVLWAQLDKSDVMSVLLAFAEAYSGVVSEYRDPLTRSASVQRLLAPKRALLLLDNADEVKELEQLLPPPGSRCSVILTSRSRPFLNREAIQINLKPLDAGRSYDLFAHQIGPRRAEDERPAIEQIITMMGGLPLALKLIARDLAEIPSLTVQEYYEGLQDERLRLETLTDYSDASVRSSFEVSFKRLQAPHQQLFCALAVFRGNDFAVEAVMRVAQQPIFAVRKALTYLHSQSLIEASPAQGGAERYRLHPLLALFAREKAGTALPNYHQRAAHHFVECAIIHRFDYGRLQLEWENIVVALDWVAGQEDWPTFGRGLEALTAINLGVVGFLDARGYWERAKDWLARALTNLDAASNTATRAILQFKAGVFALRLADYRAAQAQLEGALNALQALEPDDQILLSRAYTCEALAQLHLKEHGPAGAQRWSQAGLALLANAEAPALKHELGYLQIRHATALAQNGELIAARQAILDTLQTAGLLPPHATAARISAYLTLGMIANIQGERSMAEAYWRAGIQEAEAIGDINRQARLWQNLGNLTDEQGNFAHSIDHYQRALALYQQTGDVAGEGLVAATLAYTLLVQQGEVEQALPYLARAEQLARNHALPEVALYANVNRAYWHLQVGNDDAANELLTTALQLSQQLQDTRSEGEILRLQALVAQRQGDHAEAFALLRRALEAVDSTSLEAGIIWRAQGDLYSLLGDFQAAAAAYTQSSTLLTPYPLEQARTQISFARLAIAQAAWSSAQQLLAEAKSAIEPLHPQRELETICSLRQQLSNHSEGLSLK